MYFVEMIAYIGKHALFNHVSNFLLATLAFFYEYSIISLSRLAVPLSQFTITFPHFSTFFFVKLPFSFTIVLHELRMAMHFPNIYLKHAQSSISLFASRHFWLLLLLLVPFFLLSSFVRIQAFYRAHSTLLPNIFGVKCENSQ